MVDVLLYVGLHCLIVLLLAALILFCSPVRPSTRPLFLALGCYVLYELCSIIPGVRVLLIAAFLTWLISRKFRVARVFVFLVACLGLCLASFAIEAALDGLPQTATTETSQMNWGGTVGALLATLLMVAWLPGLSRQDIGLQWRQAPASFRPALLVTLLLCGFSALLEWKQNACPVPALEQALYLLTFSGLSEELFFRGLFPRLLSLTFSQSWRFLGIRLGWAEVLATTLFATTHSLCLVGGELSLSLWAFIVAGVQSIGFVWLRERTGSLVWPIIAHNTSKLSYTFL